jgi:hypothetical protein
MVFLKMVTASENKRRESTGGRRIECITVDVSCCLSLPFVESVHPTVSTPETLISAARLTGPALRGWFLGVLSACAVATPTWAAPAEALAQARAIYAEVNQNAPRMTTTRFRARVPAAEYTSEVVASSEQGQVRRLSVIDPDDSGNVLTDLYFTREGALVFAMRTTQGYAPNGQARTRNEHRLYFEQGRLVHMLAGMDKAAVSPGDPLARAEAAITWGMAVALRKTALAPLPTTVAVGAQRKLAEGTVISVEDGDAACYIELADAAGRLYREMADFALCEKPERLLNRHVTLTYTVGTVMAAACQGNTRCTQKDTVVLVSRAVPSSTLASAGTLPAATRKSWCTGVENEVFTCHPGDKRVSVCTSKGATAQLGQLLYRFGPATGGPADLVLPTSATAPARSATGESVGFAAGGGAWLRFRHGNHAYVVYSGIGRWGRNGATEERHGVQVEQNGKVLATLACRKTDVNELAPDWFERMGIAPDAQGFAFPNTEN